MAANAKTERTIELICPRCGIKTQDWEELETLIGAETFLFCPDCKTGRRRTEWLEPFPPFVLKAEATHGA